VHPDDKEACINAFADAFDRHEPLEIEYRLRRADGEYRWIHDCATPRTAPDGSFAGYIGSASDITEQKAAKLMLVDFNRMLLKAQETERTRIARELHDDFSQRVAGLTMLLHRVSERLGEGRDWTRVTLSEVCHQLSAVTREISALSRRLHPPVLGLVGLAKAAASYCKETSAQHNVPIQFTHANVPLDLSDDVTLGLFRVLQEALGNAVKHSKAQHIQIILLGSDDHIQLDVHDDGVGFDPTRAGHAKGLGLLSMEERLRRINGVLVINSKPGSGTSLQARVSLAARHTSLSQSIYAQEAGSRASSISERR
jgi:signal transduction histidine kinase